MRGLKLAAGGTETYNAESHLLQMRGLKPISQYVAFILYMSHLLQMRGLKHLIIKIMNTHSVASFTDAWIETIFIDGWEGKGWSHLLQMRGLKPGSAIADTPVASRIFYRCVD